MAICTNCKKEVGCSCNLNQNLKCSTCEPSAPIQNTIQNIQYPIKSRKLGYQ